MPLGNEERIIYHLAGNKPIEIERMRDLPYRTIITAYYFHLTDRLNEMRDNLTQIKEMKANR